MRFTFIAAKRAEHTVTILCRCLRVTRSGFYACCAVRNRRMPALTAD